MVLLGLTYKANVADIRESPSIRIKEILESLNIQTETYDPYIKGKYNCLEDAVSGKQAIIIGTAHQEFVNGLPIILSNSKVKVVVDGRNCLNKEEIQKLNIIYKGIGK
ncbi:MAG: UDP binding domain-containing protein [Candidatus Paceibacterota bacterium]